MYLQSVKKVILPRPVQNKNPHFGEMDPVLQRIFSSRGVQSADELDRSLASLPSPWLLTGMKEMVEHLVSAIKQQQKNYRGRRF